MILSVILSICYGGNILKNGPSGRESGCFSLRNQTPKRFAWNVSAFIQECFGVFLEIPGCFSRENSIFFYEKSVATPSAGTSEGGMPLAFVKDSVQMKKISASACHRYELILNKKKVNMKSVCAKRQFIFSVERRDAERRSEYGCLLVETSEIHKTSPFASRERCIWIIFHIFRTILISGFN